MSEREVRKRDLAEAATSRPSRLGLRERLVLGLATPTALLIAGPSLVLVIGLVLTLSNFSDMRELGRAKAVENLEARAQHAQTRLKSALGQADELLGRAKELCLSHSSQASFQQFAVHLRDLALGRTGLNWLSVSFPDGTFQGVYLEPNGGVRFQMSRRVGAATEMVRYDFMAGKLKPIEKSNLPYDPRERGFYRDAVRARKAIWTDPYPFLPDFRSGITRAEALFAADGSPYAVITVDFDLGVLSGLLDQAGRQERLVAFTQDGALLALNRTGPRVFSRALSPAHSTQFSDLSDPVLRDFFATRTSSLERERQFDSGNLRYLATEHRISVAPELNWRLAAVISEDVLLASANRQIRANLITSGTMVFGTLLISIGFAAGTRRLRSARLSAEARARRAVENAQSLGSYQLEGLIGEGGMGQVFRARHRMLARPAAIKLIRADPSGRDTAALESRFEQEAKALASLRSPNTVTVLDYGKATDGRLFLVMELLHGLPLDRVLEHWGPLLTARVIPILAGVCRSLDEAHAAGLIHRDIKPANIFLCHEGDGVERAKVIDFGLVKQPRSSAMTVADRVSGTANYMAPEQARGDPIDGRADLYALGCTAFQLLTGHAVFERTSDVATLVAHQTEVPQLESLTAQWVPAELQRLITRCLSKEPSFRPPSAGSLGRALLEIPIPPEHRILPEALRRWWETASTRERHAASA